MKPIRVGVVCDLREEEWHSMDLVADMLLDTLPSVSGRVEATRLRPPMIRRWTRLPIVGGGRRARLGDRLTGRLWDYPRWLRRQRAEFDMFHIVDHSYAHLIRALPADRTIVTCNDTDAFEAARDGKVSRLDPSRLLAEHVLDGISRASHVSCISEATRQDLISTGRVDPSRTSVAYLGAHPACRPEPDTGADDEIDRLLGPRTFEILHVSSTIPRKRIDVLLEVFSRFQRLRPDARLLRVGGPLTDEQLRLAERLNVVPSVVQFPLLERRQLAALYRRASVVVLPSDREGFGLPVIEAMACGTPVIASDIAALREVGGSAALYCPRGDVDCWVDALAQLQREQADEHARARRRSECLSAAARFDWRRYAAQMSDLYLQPLARARAS
jgi:glycosyltransferase involved in cell wall biosynthesis